MPTAQLTELGKDTGIYKFSRAFSLATRMTSWNWTSLRRVRTFRSYQWFRLRFFHNLDCVLLLFVFIRLDRKYYLYFYLNCWQNCFYKVLVCSLPSGDLLLQTECKYTIVQINAQYNVLINQVFAKLFENNRRDVPIKVSVPLWHIPHNVVASTSCTRSNNFWKLRG